MNIFKSYFQKCKNIFINLLDKVLSYKIRINYYGGNAIYIDNKRMVYAREGGTNCWVTKRFYSEVQAKKYIKRENLDFHKYNEKDKTFIVSCEVD